MTEVFSAYWIKTFFSSMKAVIGARGIKVELLCLYVQIWIDQKY
jgi:hypothetical protein